MPDHLPAPASRPPEATPPRAPAPAIRGAILMIASGLIGAVIGYTAVKLLPHDLGVRILAGAATGLLVGLIPFFIGRRRHLLLARLSLALCVVAGAVLGLLLALPVAAVLACIILAKKVDALPGA